MNNKVDNHTHTMDIWKTEQRCLNCGQKLTDRYCPSCGQSVNVHRLTFVYMIRSGFYEIVSADHGMIYTLKMLFTKPGKVITDYIEERRINYARPFNMLIILCTIYGLLAWLGYSFLGQEDTISAKSNLIINTIIKESIFTKFFNDNMAIWSLLVLPLGALITKFIFINKRYPRYNFTEFLYLCLFMTCQGIVINIIAKIWQILNQLMFVHVINLDTIIIVIYFYLTTWCLKDTFKIGWLLAVWKSLQRMLLIMLCILTIVIVALIIRKL